MKEAKNKKRQIGGLLLEALVLIFVFTSPGLASNFADNNGELTIRISPVEQIVFRDADSSSESLLQFISKIQIPPSEFATTVVDLFCFEITNESFSTSQSLYNTFYTHITASAP